MKEKILATYERESTLWKNANGFYHAQDWTKLECILVDYSEDLKNIREYGWKFIQNGKDVTEREIEKRYGRPYLIKFTNKRRTNSKCYWFKTKDEANKFFKEVMKDRILGNFKRVN